jgi:hypothetical protein
MSSQLTFTQRLLAVVVPTKAQTLACAFTGLFILTLGQSTALLSKIGLKGPLLTASQDQFHARFEVILRSPFASQTALITFWATVGLIAYLICWGAYNLVIEARNEVTLKTSYTNRGHWRGPHETLALKAVSAIGLAIVIGTLRYGLSSWVAMSGLFINDPTAGHILQALLAVVGLSVELYLVVMFVQLTFTPWYRIQTFTDV